MWRRSLICQSGWLVPAGVLTEIPKPNHLDPGCVIDTSIAPTVKLDAAIVLRVGVCVCLFGDGNSS
jgi:hypothetical protein